ncbi:MAG: type II toxin-antitoxin system RelB/DinJ family antitoxin [Oscillospiraceae bacterium]|nr:type II toxin-antitoxin system RelB/DinJ family antitoxin [Oscillospiraceae bacterium]
MKNIKSVIINIDADVEERASQILERMGIDQTTAIDMFYRQIITELRLPFQPSIKATLDEQLSETIKKSKPKKIDVTFDKNGNILIDKDLHPELYDWAVNG